MVKILGWITPAASQNFTAIRSPTSQAVLSPVSEMRVEGLASGCSPTEMVMGTVGTAGSEGSGLSSGSSEHPPSSPAKRVSPTRKSLFIAFMIFALYNSFSGPSFPSL